jgi:hypothetical protein
MDIPSLAAWIPWYKEPAEQMLINNDFSLSKLSVKS